jgi:chromate reductase, NAD(P)H dehydrogenase (quinone)
MKEHSSMDQRTILIISGTNRPDSNAMRVSRVLLDHYKKGGSSAEILSLTELPREVFDGSAYANKPPGMIAIQKRVLDAQGLHVVTPEYNGSFPGVLKYFIDMLKFPESFDRKPVAFTGEAGGTWGAIRSVEQLQLIFGYRNAHIYPDRVFIPAVRDKFDAQGKLLDAAIDERLAKQAAGFIGFSSTLYADPK